MMLEEKSSVAYIPPRLLISEFNREDVIATSTEGGGTGSSGGIMDGSGGWSEC